MMKPGSTAAVRAALRRSKSLQAVVLGGGLSGRSARALLEARGTVVRVLDDRSPQPIAREAIQGADLCVLSPGVPRSHPELQGLDVPLVGEVELAVWLADCPLVGITGTNGKSTTTALVGHILEKAGRRPFVGGNLGRPACDMVQEDFELAVLELSSFQLESLETASFEVGAWLNLSADHLDRYPNEEAYAEAKARMLPMVAGHCVANSQDATVRRFVELHVDPHRVRWFDRADYGLQFDGPGLLGPHNLLNGKAAVEICLSLGVEKREIQDGLSSFEGLPHRLRAIASDDGIHWLNDSKATNVAAAANAVMAMEHPTFLIAGGQDKGGSWQPLVEAALGRVKEVLAIGDAAPLVEQAFEGRISVRVLKSLEAAVAYARSSAGQGEAVLLAPGCASFDQFPNYQTRGERFESLVRGEV